MAVLKRFPPNLLSTGWFILMAIIWLAFAPTQAGGLASYIVVIGNSMEPGFHIGDLVIAHKQADYQIGDVVVYRNLELNNFVFHRIIADEMGKFTLQGDNNTWKDTYQPTREEVIGKLWLQMPRGGIFIQKLRNPFVMAIAAGSLAGFVVLSLFRGKARGNKRMKQKTFQVHFASLRQKLQSWFVTSNKPVQGNMLETGFFALGVLALISLIVGIFSFSRPAYRIVKDAVQFEHVGFFSYSASAPEGVYDSNAIKSGDPIFPKLTCTVDVNFQYTFIAQEKASIAGTHQLTAMITESVGGWQRVLPLQEVTSFSGNVFGTTAKLNLCQVEKLIQSMEEETGFHAGSYLLTITPNIQVAGDIGGSALESTFNPILPFNYDHVHFFMYQGDGEKDLLHPTETGVTGGEHQIANTLLFFGMNLAVLTLRWFSVIVLVGSLAGVAFIGVKTQELSKCDPSQFIRMRYDSMLVDVQQTVMGNTVDIVEVNSIDSLAKMAEKSNAMILHAEIADSHVYYFRVEGTTYRFMLPFETGSIIPEKEA